MTDKQITVLLAEDHAVTRLGIKLYLEADPAIKVIGEAGTGIECLSLASSLKPDVILMDVAMPGLDGIAAVRQLRDQGNTAKVIMVTSHGGEAQVMNALSVGASGYCLKAADQERLLTAVKCVFAGDLWLDAAVASIVLRAVRTNNPTQKGSRPPNQEPLSERELEVLEQIVAGHTNQEIGRRLYISGDTVKTHIRHIMEKLAVNDRTQAAVKAVRQGLV